MPLISSLEIGRSEKGIHFSNFYIVYAIQNKTQMSLTYITYISERKTTLNIRVVQ